MSTENKIEYKFMPLREIGIKLGLIKNNAIEELLCKCYSFVCDPMNKLCKVPIDKNDNIIKENIKEILGEVDYRKILNYKSFIP